MSLIALATQTPTRRQRWAAWLRREADDLRRRGWIFLVVVGVLWGGGHYLGLSYARHLSLPYPLWGHTHFPPADIARGDYVVVDLPPAVARLFPPGSTFIKEVVGMPGDRVEARSGVYTVLHDGQMVTVGLAKSVSRKGLPLPAGPVGVIPPGHYFIRGTHPDSLDSRYAMMGWVTSDRIVGLAVPLLPAAASRLWQRLGWSEQ